MDSVEIADQIATVGRNVIQFGWLVFVGKPTPTRVEFRFDHDPGDNWARHLYSSLVPLGLVTAEDFAGRVAISSPVQEGAQWVISVDVG